jgi:Anti-sigma-K factor rskA/Putative zinc-finger
MTKGDHTTYRDEVGAYLLGALSDAERASFEGHLADCPECRHEVERLRPAADLLPRSVEQVEPPPSLKRSLMEVVEREAKERDGGTEPARERARRPLGERLRDLLGGALRPALVAAGLALGLLVGYGVAQLGDDDNGRTVVARVEPSVLPDASGRLEIQGDGTRGGILEVRGMPSLDRGRVYQAWVQRDGMIEPEPTFDVGADGRGAVAVPEDLSDAQAVLLTREPRGGSRAPSEDPILKVAL